MRTIASGISTPVDAAANIPLELYEIYLDGTTLRFTDYSANVAFGGNTYTAWGIKRTGIKSTMDLSVNEVSVEVDNIDLTMSGYFTGNLYEWRGVNVKIKKVFADYLSNSANYILLFDGTIDEPEIDQRRLKFKVRSWIASLNVECPRRLYHGLCNWTFGGTECGITQVSKTGTINTVSTTKSFILNMDWSITGMRYDYWNNGTLAITISGQTEKRKIKDSSDNYTSDLTTMDIYTPFRDLTPANGVVAVITTGCDKTKTNCIVHDNILNHGGFLSVVDKWNISTVKL